MASKIYITGATGRLGRAVLERIDATALVRKPSGLKRGVVTDFSVGQLKSILKDADVIIHLAGSVDTWDARKLREGNVELTRRILEAAPERCRIVFASSISVYGKELKETPADEDTAAKPDSAYSRTKYEAERMVASRPDHVILRIGTLYGPRFEDYFRILSMIELGKMKMIGDGKNHIPFVHVDDVAGAVRAAIGKGDGTYVLAGEPLGQEEVLSIAARELGVPAPAKSVSRGIAMAMTALGEKWCLLIGKKPKMTVEHVAVLSYDRVFDCSKAAAELGFSSRPLEKGISEMVKAYKSRKPR
ncbi:MAG: NAD-dependent epimerase/dehydratase family protein [Candidatus Micrarchaeota archaeon]